MGDPWHIARERPELRHVEWRSSNYSLYGDMSRRMYEVLAERVRFILFTANSCLSGSSDFSDVQARRSAA